MKLESLFLLCQLASNPLNSNDDKHGGLQRTPELSSYAPPSTANRTRSR